MTEAVLDASALLAFLKNEPGAQNVAAVLSQCCISAVNLGESLSKMVEYGKSLDAASYQVERLQIPVIDFDADQAKMLASLWKGTRLAGLSLGDRACLGLGLKRQAVVLTTDRDWAKVDVGVRVEVIR